MNRQQREPQRIAQLLILGSYTALAVGLVAETVLMSWELWAIPLILGAVTVCWFVHIRQRMSSHQRIWVYTVMMMGTFFFYGTHVTSTYDMALLMMLMMIIFTIVGESKLVSFCLITYYVTLSFDLWLMFSAGTVWDSLLVSRTILHIVLMFMAGWLARFIIREWALMFRDSDERIEELNKTTTRMTAFMSNISHELRTPVNAITGTAKLMLDRETDGQLREELMTVREAAGRMAMQIDDIMDYSEMETGKLVVQNEPYSLASLFNDVLAELKPRVPEGVELVVDVDANTPSGMVSDARKLRKILYHIIGNSLRFTTQGGVYVHVTSVKQAYGVNLCIEVTDTGIGMDEAEAGQVLQRFYQTDAGKTVSTGGLGLGLPIASRFVRSLGGFMLIKSKPGCGTTVRMSIPQKVSDAQGCMSVLNREQIHLAGFLNIGKFPNPNVREFYNAAILGIVQGLGTPMHRVDNVDDLKKLLGKVHITHLFTGVEEYLSASDYLESLADQLQVMVVASDPFMLPARSRALVIPKPLSGFSIASVLNAREASVGDDRLFCPEVRALVVDDEPMNLTVASGILKTYGMHVTVASSGAEALRLCRSETFDVVFMDHMMPELDGVETLKRLRTQQAETHRDTPVIALTANALSSAREMFLHEGFDGFVSKPIELPELERVLRRVLPKDKLLTVSVDEARRLQQQRVAPPLETDVEKNALTEAGISPEDGRRYCQNDEELYLSLLGQFAADCPDKERHLGLYCQREDCANYLILVHALKGTARMIGAGALSEQARAMESAVRAGDLSYLRANHDALLASYRQTVDAIRAFLAGEGAVRPTMEEEADVFEFFPEEGDIP